MQKKIIKPNIHKVSISLNEIRKLTKEYNFVEISIELENITSNPISIYENIANKQDPGFILDFINPGEKVLGFIPTFSYYSHPIQLSGGVYQTERRQSDYSISLDQAVIYGYNYLKLYQVIEIIAYKQ